MADKSLVGHARLDSLTILLVIIVARWVLEVVKMEVILLHLWVFR
jgi:hypothetical protein